VTGTGSASVDLEVANNTAATAVLSNVASSQAGTLEVELSPGPLNVNSPHFTYLGSLQIDAEPGPSPPRAALVGTANGNGSIVASPAQADYAVGEFIHLTAVSAPGWVFAGWSGDGSGAANPLVVMADADPAVTATFVQNTAPAVSVIVNRVINEDTSTGAIPFTIGDAETPMSSLVLNKYSSNPALVAPSGLVLGGSGTNRTINVTPLPNAYGTATITISVSDGELATEASFLLTVTPLHDDQPVAFADFFTIDEDTTLEDDVSLNDTIGVDGGTFAVVTAPDYGDLTLDPDGGFFYDPAPDFEGVDSFTYRITDSDGDISGATVTINITGVNEAPVAQDAPFAVAENSPSATVVGSVTAIDPDAGQTLAFAITAGNESGAFAINPGTGEITVAGALDYEMQAQHVLGVTVTDNHVPALADTATITINITGVNEAPVAQDAPFAVVENSPAGTAVGTVTAGDPDAGQPLAFTISAGNESGAFAINPGTGEITVAGALDYETQTQHVLTVAVTDDHVPALSDTATITIDLTDVNESLQAFYAWRAGYGLTGEPSDDSDAGGLNNHIEFLFDYDPTDPLDDLLLRLELVIGDGNVEVAYPELMPVGDYHLSMAADPSQLANPANRVETITKAQIEAMSGAERGSRTYTAAQVAGPVFFRLELEPSPLE
jgi:VCBS repeat-containing protein